MSEENLLRLLARSIDPDEPPGMGAHILARTVVRLVRGRGGKGAVHLAIALDKVAAAHPREESTGPTPATGALGTGGETISWPVPRPNMAKMNYYRVTAEFNHTDQTYWVMTMNPMFGPVPPDMAIQLGPRWRRQLKVASENGAMLEFDEVWELINPLGPAG